ncbi:MAG: hypothetical protein JJU06_04475 [Ectothiorhodospiraceae bacterium]|nr:hypothetical protein [Ectothiorhodospiraceae bacterium]MCH8503347.1 hypothetical protein [Ectothiorhodospiraceae bacterium]
MLNQEFNTNLLHDTATHLSSLPAPEAASYLEQLDSEGRTRLFRLLPQHRQLRVYAALAPSKQNRELAEVLASHH